MDLALNYLQRLICHKNQPINQPTCSQQTFVFSYTSHKREKAIESQNLIYIYIYIYIYWGSQNTPLPLPLRVGYIFESLSPFRRGDFGLGCYLKHIFLHLEEMLNSVSTSFFRLLDFFDICSHSGTSCLHCPDSWSCRIH